MTNSILFLMFLVFDSATLKPPVKPTPAGVLRPPPCSIDVAGWKLTKGAPKNAILAQLPAEFEMVRTKGSDDGWLVREKIHSNHLFALLTFKDDRLSAVSRLWASSSDNESVDLSTQILDLIERLSNEYGETARIAVKDIKQDDVTIKQIQLVFGPKRVSLYVVDRLADDGSHRKEVHVDESIE